MKKKLQIFVSSTYEDLKDERQAAVSAILKAGHIPAGMELFTSGDESQMETIKRWIDESDVYMLILGGRYGSVEPNTSLSYTELEYDYAVKSGMPFFAVVIDEAALEQKARDKGTNVIEKENPKELKVFRKKVLSKMSAFFKDSSDIRLAVYETIADFLTKYEFKGWVSGDTVASEDLLNQINELRKSKESLQSEIENLRFITNSSIFSPQEEIEFKFIYEKLNRNFEVTIRYYKLLNLNEEKKSLKTPNTLLFQVPIFSLICLFSKSHTEYEPSAINRFIREYEFIQDKIKEFADSFIEHKTLVESPALYIELFSYGLLERELNVNNSTYREYNYLISPKMHKLAMWAESNGLIQLNFEFEVNEKVES